MESDNAVSFGPERASPFARGLPQCTARKALPPRNLPRENECRPPGCTAPPRPPALKEAAAPIRAPQATRPPLPKVVLDIIRQARDLLLLVLRRNGNQDRLVKSAPHHLHLPAPRQLPDQREVVGPVFLHPLKQRPRIVQSHVDRRMPLQQLQERQIALLIRFLEDVPEVAARLVRMKQQYEMKILCHSKVFRHNYHTLASV